MNISLFLEVILLLIAILVSNGIIYSFTIFNFNFKTRNSTKNILVIRNSSEKDLTLLFASNSIRLTSSGSSSPTPSLSDISSEISSSSQALSDISSGSSTLVNSTSSDTVVSQDILDNLNN